MHEKAPSEAALTEATLTEPMLSAAAQPETGLTADVAVVGAGPAGLAAAVAAADAGLRVVLIDAGSQPGGQFWRHPAEGVEAMKQESVGHHDWKTFAGLRARLYRHVELGRVRYLREHQVWLLERAGAASVLRLTETASSPAPANTAHPETVPANTVPIRTVMAEHLILCPGGYDRQLPIPGWTLPGVMAAGGVQALLKGSGTLAGKRAIVAGTGPFLLPVAAALAHAGAKVVAICEANSPVGWAKNALGAARTPAKALEAAEYAAVLAKYRVPYRTRTAVTAIHGVREAQWVTLSQLDRNGAPRAGNERDVDVDLVALGWGFTPSLELVIGAGVDTTKDVDGSLVAVVDRQQRGRIEGVYDDRIRIAGEVTGIGGATMAVHEGELAAIAIARDQPPARARARSLRAVDARIRWLKRSIAASRAFAVAMHRANPVPRDWRNWLTPETTVCRCEEVRYGEIVAAHDQLGAEDPRTVKALTRAGMGWCQGRVCGFATTEIVAGCRGRASTADDMRPMAKRTLATPVTLAELAEASPPEPRSKE